VIEWGRTEDQAIAAVLHDAIEDQPEQTPEVEIRLRFGDEVVAMVLGLSDAEVIPKPPWLARKRAYFVRLKSEPKDVVLISAADKLHNARAILSDFVSQGHSLWSRFSVSDQGALPQVWYFKTCWRSTKTGSIAGSHGSFGPRSRNSPGGRICRWTTSRSQPRARAGRPQRYRRPFGQAVVLLTHKCAGYPLGQRLPATDALLPTTDLAEPQSLRRSAILCRLLVSKGRRALWRRAAKSNQPS